MACWILALQLALEPGGSFCSKLIKSSEYMAYIPFVPSLWAPAPQFPVYTAHKLVAGNESLVTVEVVLRAAIVFLLADV
jgi:hypothetical protein